MHVFRKVSLLTSKLSSQGYSHTPDPRVVWFHVTYDVLIAVAYLCFSILFIYFIRTKPWPPLHKRFWIFETFFLACITTHVLGIWNIWHSTYLAAALVQGITAALSVLTAATLISLAPKVILLPNFILSRQQDLRRLSQAEAALQENLGIKKNTTVDPGASQELLRRLLDGVRDYAIYSLDATGNVISWNAGASRIKGYSESEILGQNFSVFYTSADRAAGKPSQHLLDSLSQGRYEEQAQRVRKDGSSFWANVVISPIYDNQGKHKGFTKIARDISDLKMAADQTLREQAEILDLAQIMVRDTQGRIVTWSAGLERLYGFMREEAVGRVSHELLHTQFSEPLQQIEERLEHDGTWQGEVEHCTRDGRLVIATSVWVLHRDLHGKPSLVMESNTDITVRKQMEERLARRTQELTNSQESLEIRTKDLAKAVKTLESSNIELQQFAYVASHDLQSPLRSISGFVELLATEYEEKLDDQGRDYIRRTVQSVTQMQTLIHDLLSYCRVESRSRPFVHVPLMDAFYLSVSLLESSIRDTGGQVTCGELPVVLGDGSQLTQLLQNLIGNGLKYHGTDPPHVHVTAEPGKDKNGWIVSVRDDGIGIDPKYLSRIFEIFKRLHNSAEFPGTGIGLAVCRRVVERHGGTIWAESALGNGSNFRFSIPAYVAAGPSETDTGGEANGQQPYQNKAS